MNLTDKIKHLRELLKKATYSSIYQADDADEFNREIRLVLPIILDALEIMKEAIIKMGMQSGLDDIQFIGNEALKKVDKIVKEK
jgi:hypothetical protein